MAEPIVKQNKTKRGNPHWLAGNSGNPNGRPKNPETEELRKALALAKKEHKKSFLKHFVDRAFRDDGVAIALARKILPDKSSNDVDVELNFPVINIHLPNDNTKP